jgi:hypothetical protein
LIVWSQADPGFDREHPGSTARDHHQGGVAFYGNVGFGCAVRERPMHRREQDERRRGRQCQTQPERPPPPARSLGRDRDSRHQRRSLGAARELTPVRLERRRQLGATAAGTQVALDPGALVRGPLADTEQLDVE